MKDNSPRPEILKYAESIPDKEKLKVSPSASLAAIFTTLS